MVQPTGTNCTLHRQLGNAKCRWASCALFRADCPLPTSLTILLQGSCWLNGLLESLSFSPLSKACISLSPSWMQTSKFNCSLTMETLGIPWTGTARRLPVGHCRLCGGGGGGGGISRRPYNQQRPMRTNLSCCLGLSDNGQHKSTNRLLVWTYGSLDFSIFRVSQKVRLQSVSTWPKLLIMKVICHALK